MTILTTLLLTSLSARAMPYGFGLGAIAGEPTGISIAWRDDPGRTIQGHIAWSFIDARVRGNFDFLKVITNLEGDGDFIIPVYLGFGLTAGYNAPLEDFTVQDVTIEDFGFGARIPFGGTIHLEKAPVEFFGEVALTFEAYPAFGVGAEGGVGVRFYF